MHEMQIPYEQTRLQKSKVEHIWLRQVLTLPTQETFILGFETPVGGPYLNHKILLDSHPQRTEPSGRIRGKKASDYQNILRQLTRIREPGREPDTDPILWMLRVWGAIRSATLAFSDLQPHEKLSGTTKIPAGFPPAETAYFAMALRSYHELRIQHGDDELCHGLLNRLQLYKAGGPRISPGAVPDNETRHRLLWFEAASCRSREEAVHNLKSAGLLTDRRPQVPLGSMDSEQMEIDMDRRIRLENEAGYKPPRTLDTKNGTGGRNPKSNPELRAKP